MQLLARRDSLQEFARLLGGIGFELEQVMDHDTPPEVFDYLRHIVRS